MDPLQLGRMVVHPGLEVNLRCISENITERLDSIEDDCMVVVEQERDQVVAAVAILQVQNGSLACASMMLM